MLIDGVCNSFRDGVDAHGPQIHFRCAERKRSDTVMAEENKIGQDTHSNTGVHAGNNFVGVELA